MLKHENISHRPLAFSPAKRNPALQAVPSSDCGFPELTDQTDLGTDSGLVIRPCCTRLKKVK
jgi:hypothetical protein